MLPHSSHHTQYSPRVYKGGIRPHSLTRIIMGRRGLFATLVRLCRSVALRYIDFTKYTLILGNQ